MLSDLGRDLLDVSLPFVLAPGHLLSQIIIYFRMQIFEGQVVQFDLDPGNAQPGSNRTVDIQGLLGDPQLLVRPHMPQGTHIMEAVRQFDHDDPDILGHGEEHLAQVPGLLLLGLHALILVFLVIARIFELLQLGDSVDQQGYVRSEFPFQLLFGKEGIFDHIMEKPAGNGLLVHFQVGQDDGHLQGMDNIRLAGFTLLPFMGLLRDRVGLFNQGDIIGRMIPADALDQVLVQFLGTYVFTDIFNFAVVKFALFLRRGKRRRLGGLFSLRIHLLFTRFDIRHDQPQITNNLTFKYGKLYAYLQDSSNRI